jgi:hypothetical protein
VYEALRFGDILRERYVNQLSVVQLNNTYRTMKLATCGAQLCQQTALAVGAGVTLRQSQTWPEAWRPMPASVLDNKDVRSLSGVSRHNFLLPQVLNGRINCPEVDTASNRAVFASPWFTDANNIAYLRLLIQRAGMGRFSDLSQLYTLWDTLQSMVTTPVSD